MYKIAHWDGIAVLEFFNKPWVLGLGIEYEYGCRTGPPEPEFLNFYGALESIPRKRIRQPM
jgi:hypothetical protein